MRSFVFWAATGWIAFGAMACETTETADDDDDSSGGSGGAPPQCDGTVDFLTDPKNCGICGHDCLGGECLQGICQPIVLSGEGLEPASVEVDTTHVYWIGGMDIFRVPKLGGPTETLAAGIYNLADIEVDGVSVFYGTDDDWVASDLGVVPAVGGAPMVLGQMEGPTGMALYGDHLYWTSRYVGVFRMLKTGGPTEQLDTTTSLAVGTAVDSTSVYWVLHETDISADTIALIKTPLAGGVGTSIVQPMGYPIDVATDGESAFVSWRLQFAGNPNVIAQVPAAGGAAVHLLEPPVEPGMIAVDGTHLYFTLTDGTVQRIAKGGGTPEVLLANLGTLTSIALDDRALYVTRVADGTNLATVIKLAK